MASSQTTEFVRISYFERLNADDSDINILMGSRSFYEGWDSNRPNVINFINIGTGIDAKKFILQSVGRGVRIQPFENKRKRLLSLYNAGEIDATLFRELDDRVLPLESLFIFGTNKDALDKVLEHLDAEARKEPDQPLTVYLNEDVATRKLLIPVYKQAEHPYMEQHAPAKFEIAESEYALLKEYVEYLGDDRVLLALYESEPSKIAMLRTSLAEEQTYYRRNGRSYGNVHLLARRVLDYFGIVPREFDRLKKLEKEIVHFERIAVTLKDVTELQGKIERVKNSRRVERELQEQYGKMPVEEYLDRAREVAASEEFEYGNQRVKIKRVSNHYYVPLILSDDEKIDYIKHIIKTPSEVDFVNDVERYLQRPENQFKQFDWWLFSKLDESLDEVHLPYYNPKTNGTNKFKPDFIFWLQKGGEYFIVFVDPKGTAFTGYEHKMDGYKRLFEVSEGKCRVIEHEGLRVRVLARLYTIDANAVPDGYRRYWSDNIGRILEQLLAIV